MNYMFLTASIFIACTLSAQKYTYSVAAALKQKDAVRALELLQKTLQKNPYDNEAVLQTATILFLTHHYRLAAQFYEQAVAADPECRNIRYNCATAYSKYGNFSCALEHYEKVYCDCPDEQTKSVLFKLYIRCQQWKKAIALQTPSLWWYNENICGKTILLNCDKPGNGFGDVIQFIRYAQILNQAGARVLVKAPTPLHPLLRQCHYIDQIIESHDSIPHHDKAYDICIASLLLQMRDQITMNKPQQPYLFADQQLISFWQNSIPQDGTLKVGLCWKSNLVRDNFTEKIIPSPRSISLEELAPLAHSDITFYSLQKLPNPVESPFPLTQYYDDFDEEHGRFMDTAALIMNMDLIITVDTSIAHLAGALGKPVWLLLSCESDYRWFLHTEKSPLYPSLHLFRQQSYGDWDPIITTMQITLHKQATTQRNRE